MVKVTSLKESAFHHGYVPAQLSSAPATYNANSLLALNRIISGVPQGLILGPLFSLIFINNLPNSNFMKTIIFANDRVLVQGDNNLGLLQNSVNREMTNVMVGCLQTNSH